MTNKHMLYIGAGALALWFLAKPKPTVATASTVGATPGSTPAYTTSQADNAAQWWNFGGLWNGSNGA
ncbi:hypothetical protein [Roseateles sp.]|uniref:hypothetical protein n=1 Tax=Roseateles sp. TaxID=1971397 RepID=UPI002DFB0392|nr:hypothetical protein [Roseateles sp.]